MRTNDTTFIDRAVAGDLPGELEEHLDRYVERWHGAGHDEVPLHEFLGMTWREYQRTAQPGGLEQVVRDRSRG